MKDIRIPSNCTITKLEVRNLRTGKIVAESDQYVDIQEGDNISIDWEGKNNGVGVQNFLYNNVPIHVDDYRVQQMKDQQMFFLNSKELKFRPVPPKPVTFRSFIKEVCWRLELAWASLRHGSSYFD